jgi:hypothetical protein
VCEAPGSRYARSRAIGVLEPGARSLEPVLLMAERKSFLLRIDPEILEGVQRWANDDLRSLNGQIEFLLRKVLKQEGRLPSESVASRERGSDRR